MVVYPIEGTFRGILLNIETIILFVFMEIAFYFFYKYWTNRKNGIPSVVELDWGIMFGAFGVAYIFYIYGDFYASVRADFLLLGYISLILGGTLYLYHLEWSRTFKTKYVLSSVAFIFLLVVLGVFFFAPEIVQSVASFISIYAFGVIFFYFLLIIKKTWGYYKLFSIGLFVGIFVWLVGFMGTADFAIELFGTVYIRIIGDILILIGMVMVALFMNTIPSMAEIGWQDKVKYIILTSNSGLQLYGENFQQRTALNELLISGAVVGVQMFLKNLLSKDDGFKTISRGNEAIIINKGKYVMGIMVVEQELEILKYLLDKLIKKVEEYFGTILADWSGDTAPFHSVKYLIDEIFTVSKL